MSTEKAGQAAYEAFWANRGPRETAFTFSEELAGVRKAWEAAAQAAVTAAAAAQGASGTFAWQADTFVRAAEGETVVIGFRHPITQGEVHDVREHFAAAAPGVNIVIVGDVDSIDVEQPAPAAAPGEALRIRLGHALAALREIARQEGDDSQDLACKALDDDKALRENAAAAPGEAAPELRAAMAETRKVREQHRDLLDMFHGTGSGYTLRLSGVRLTRMYTTAGIPVPDRYRHLEGQ